CLPVFARFDVEKQPRKPVECGSATQSAEGTTDYRRGPSTKGRYWILWARGARKEKIEEDIRIQFMTSSNPRIACNRCAGCLVLGPLRTFFPVFFPSLSSPLVRLPLSLRWILLLWIS